MNNFDQSSSGVDVVVSLFLDLDLSGINFNDSMEHLRGDSYQYIDYGNVKGFEDFDDMFEISTENPIRKFTTALVREGMQEDFTGCKSWDDFYNDFMMEFSFPEDLPEFVEILEVYDIDHKCKFDRKVVSGYSQGDVAEVFIPVDQMRTELGIADDIADEDIVDDEHIKNLCFDAPLSFRVEVNGEEYCPEIDGMYLNSPNDYDKDDSITEICTAFHNDVDVAILREELQELLPEDLDRIEYI